MRDMIAVGSRKLQKTIAKG